MYGFGSRIAPNNDLYNVVKAEFIAMRLAQEVGLNVAPVQLTRAMNKDVLLIERFDRIRVAAQGDGVCAYSFRVG